MASPRPSSPHRAPACPRLLWLAACGTLWLAACGTGPGNDVAEARCLHALAYRFAAASELDVERIVSDPRRQEVGIDFEVDWGPFSRAVRSQLTCRYTDEDPWEFTAIEVDGEPISETGLLLVNGDLLLRDLREHPERFRDVAVRRRTP